MYEDSREQKERSAETVNSFGRTAVMGLLRSLVNRFAAANQEQQHWLSGILIEKRTARVGFEHDGASGRQSQQ